MRTQMIYKDEYVHWQENKLGVVYVTSDYGFTFMPY